MRDQAWWFASTGGRSPSDQGTLLVAGSTGLYRIEGDTIVAGAGVPATARSGRLRCYPPSLDPARVWVGLFDGLTSFRLVNGEWVDEGRIPGITEQVRSLDERRRRVAMGRHAGHGGIPACAGRSDRLGYRPPRPTAIVDRFGGSRWHLHRLRVACSAVDGEPYFGAVTNKLGVFRFDEAASRFVRVSEFDDIGTDMRNPGLRTDARTGRPAVRELR